MLVFILHQKGGTSKSDRKIIVKKHSRIFHLQNLNVMMTLMQYAALHSI